MLSRMPVRLVLLGLLAVLGISTGIAKEDKSVKANKPKKNTRETAFFAVDLDKKEITGLTKTVRETLKFKFYSVTTDQPIYWPSEDVFLKVLLPASPDRDVEITLTRKDSAPRKIGKFKLNAGGMLVETILSGQKKKLEPGEYRVDMKTADGKLSGFTTFTVVEGALGSLSFGHDFEQVTDPKKLEKLNGAWFMGNASGVGNRWGNGLNVKNELRYMNRPYSGDVIVKSRCYLPGCDGCDAGPEVRTKLENGRLQVAMEVGGHSGPFAIEVITKQGSLNYLFGKSGHVERQTIPVSMGLGNSYSATLAPYEKTVEVAGRGIYIVKDGENRGDPVELGTPIADNDNEIILFVRKELRNAKIVVYYPVLDDEFKSEEIKAGTLRKGDTYRVKCRSPYTLVAVGGFDRNDYKEGWTIAFTQSAIDVDIDAPLSGLPNRPVEITVSAFDRFTKKGMPVYGILEVFDNRVQSKSAQEPLVSSLGDSVREYANYLVSWRDWTGYGGEEYKEYADGAPMEVEDSAMSPQAAAPVRAKLAKSMSRNGASVPGAPGETAVDGTQTVEDQEEVREGEKKVLYCGLLLTDSSGKARVTVTLPPQTGRCKIRFTAVSKYDYEEKSKDIDVKKQSYLEVNLLPLLMPDATITAKATVVNTTGGPVKLIVSGAGVAKTIEKEVRSTLEEVRFTVTGAAGAYGKMEMKIVDAKGKTLDRREIELKNIGSYPVTFSDVIISDGSRLNVKPGERAAVFSGPGMLLQGMVNNIVTSMYSWFGHAEALSAAAAIRAYLLAAFEAKILDDEGMRDTVKSDLAKTVRDISEAFYDRGARLIRPYPGLAANALWSAWTIRNLAMMANVLKQSPALKKEFEDTIRLADELKEKVLAELRKEKIDILGESFYDFDRNGPVVPVEVNGKVVYKLLTDTAVVKWFVNKMLPGLDADPKGGKSITEAFQINYDIYRFLRSVERTGELYYLTQNAKALYLAKDRNFQPLFNKIAKGVIQTQEPGVIKGPALLGGVYSSPLTVAAFLDLLLTMAKDKSFEKMTAVIDGKTVRLGRTFAIVEPAGKPASVQADPSTVIRVDRVRDVNLLDFADRKPFFQVKLEGRKFAMADETDIVIELSRDLDPSEYYAIVAVPSVLTVKQTEDLLSDYKGQLLYGQRATGGEKIQLLTVPFRGKRRMVLKLEASQIGASGGYVLVRHVSNPDMIATVRIPEITVK